MKNTKHLFGLFAVLLLVASSCSGLLEEEPTTFYDEETIFSTEEGVETAVNGVYAAFSAGGYHGTAWHNILAPTSGKFFSTQVANRDATGLNTIPNNPNLDDFWSQAFATINVANTVINNLENTDLDSLTLPNKNVALGESYFLRAVTYFDLVRLFGGVPMRTVPTDLEGIHMGRSTKAEIYELLMADFEKAKSMLPAPGSEQMGRPNKLAANMYMAKVFMTLAGEDGGDDALWTKAYDEAIAVFNAQYYSLTPTYAELFFPDNENTSEAIFELQYGHTGGARNADLVRLFTPSNSLLAPANTVTFGRLRPNKETFDQHLEQYPDDPRINATFIYDSYEKVDGGTQKVYPLKNTGNQGFPLVRKWLDPTYNGTTTSRNYILLRYADLLLMLAEIENELTGPDNAYQYVNQVLERARDIDGDGISDSVEPADWTALSQDDFRDRILRERQYELLSEGHEWFDTRRRGYEYFLQEVVELHNAHPTFDPSSDFVYPISVKNMLLPIPLTEISGNQLISPGDQNPGY